MWKSFQGEFFREDFCTKGRGKVVLWHDLKIREKLNLEILSFFAESKEQH